MSNFAAREPRNHPGEIVERAPAGEANSTDSAPADRIEPNLREKKAFLSKDQLIALRPQARAATAEYWDPELDDGTTDDLKDHL